MSSLGHFRRASSLARFLQVTEPDGLARCGRARAPPGPGPPAVRRRALPGPGDDPHRQPPRAAAGRGAAALRRRGPHLRAAPPRAPGLGAARRARRVRRRAGDAARGVVGQGQHPPALGRHPRRPLRHPTRRGPGPARGLPRRAQTVDGLRPLAGWPTGWCGCSGGRCCRSTPTRPTCGCPRRPRPRGGTARGDHRRPAARARSTRSCSRSGGCIGTWRSGPTTNRRAGDLGRALPGVARTSRGPRRRRNGASSPAPGPHPGADAATAGAGRRAAPPAGLGHPGCWPPRRPGATASSSPSTASGSFELHQPRTLRR